jgi:hypothetical protein
MHSTDVASLIEKCQAQITPAVQHRSSDFAKAIGLTVSSSRLEQELTRALLEAVFFHLAPKPTSAKELRMQMLRLANAARKAAEAVREVQSALDQVDQIYRKAILEQKPQLAFPLKTAITLQSLSDLAHLYVVGATRSGGAPKMIVFEILVRRLSAVFKGATGRAAKVTWNAHKERYEGKFVNLVEAVLPIAVERAERLGTDTAHLRTALARGKYILELTRSRRNTFTAAKQ